MSIAPIERDDAPDPEVIDFYVTERPGMDRNIIAAFVYAGIEPPERMEFFTHAQEKLIHAYYYKFDPNGARREYAELGAV